MTRLLAGFLVIALAGAAFAEPSPDAGAAAPDGGSAPEKPAAFLYPDGGICVTIEPGSVVFSAAALKAVDDRILQLEKDALASKSLNQFADLLGIPTFRSLMIAAVVGIALGVALSAYLTIRYLNPHF